MFGKPFGTSTNTSAFGGGTSLFGSTTAKPSVGFGSPSNAQSGSLFGQKPLFGSTPQQTTSLFGNTQTTATTSTSLFGQTKPLFGSSTTNPTQTNAFGGGTTSIFGSTQPTTQSGSLFSTGFGANTQMGTTIKFEPPTASDTMLRNGTNQTINTKHMCITSMKQYEGKSLEELRCEDYIANRRGATTGGGLTFGQTQPTTSTSLFGGNTATTQSSLFGAQNKSLFGGGTSSAFGTTTTSTTTPSLFGASTTTGQSSLFGSANKPATGLFGTQQATATTSPFGQTQQQTTGGLFGAKPTTGFGTQPTTSLFGGSSSFGSTTTASPFTFGSNTATATPFGQTQTTSAFGGTFGQTTASTATSGGLFGAKPAATGGFGGFGTNTATSAPFGSQPSGVGLFGAKPAGGSLFGSTSGSAPFGGTTTSTSLFGSTAAKPTTSLFGATSAQTGFSVAPTAANVMTAQTAVAPIVLGSDVNQTAIQNAIIEAQLASCPYGDSPLLKLVSSETLKKSDIPSPTNLQRQMRFLASKAKGGSGGSGAAMSSATTLVSTTTTRTTPAIALSSLPTAGSPINISVQPSSNNLLNSSRPFNHLSYKSIYSSPNSATTALSNPPPLTDSAVSRPSILKHGSANASMFSAEAGSGRGKADETRNDVKRLDLNRLKKSLEAGKQRHPLSSSQTAATTSAVSPSSVNGSIQQDRTDHDTASAESQQHNVNGEMQNGDLKSTGLCRPVLSPETENVREKRRAELRKEQPPIRLNLNSDYNTSTDLSSSTALIASSENSVVSGARSVISAKPHPAGITLRRRDYVCEPTLDQLAVMAERNNGVCRIEKGFTIRRFGYGSVFWPGPFDLSNIDIDEVVHFRQNEVIVYPDDSNKPSVGEKLNRFAEISLERVWPLNKKTKEPITDPIELERMHFREKLERVSARMDANFKDYRPETGTWVFTVPHFTKYGLPDESDEDDENLCSETELRSVLDDSRIQNAVQRDQLKVSPKQTTLHQQKRLVINGRYVSSSSPEQSATLQSADTCDSNIRMITDISELPTPRFNRHDLYDEMKYDSLPPMSGILNFDQTIDSVAFTPAKGLRIRQQKVEPLDDASRQLIEVMEDSFAIEPLDERKEREKMRHRIELKKIEPEFDIAYAIRLQESFVTKMRAKRSTLVDQSLFNIRRTRIGWTHGGLFVSSALPASFDVHLIKIDYPDELPQDYIIDIFEHNIRLSCRNSVRQYSADTHSDLTSTAIDHITPSKDYAQMVDSFIATSKQSKMPREESVWKLCSALFTHPSLQNASSDYTRGITQRESVGYWLRETIAAKHLKLPASGKKRILFHLLTGNLVDAVDEAVNINLPLLAVAMSSFLETDRTTYRRQVESWIQSQSAEYIDEDLLRIYMIMAGVMHVKLKSKSIFVCDGLNWMRALGAFVWYYDSYDAMLKEVLVAFEEDIQQRNCAESIGNNVFYELMKLAAERSHPLETILEPSAFGTHPFDYHLSWHLWCVLRSIGYEHIDDFVERCLHIRYAEQLVNVHLTHLAIFVLMHICDSNARYNAVSEMVDRIVPEADEALYEKMRTVCGLSDEVIAHSKYMQAKLRGDEESMCIHALDAAMYDEAHSLFCESVAPKAVTLDDDELLGRLCEKFECKSDRISCWGPRGQIYTDYFHLKEGIHEILDESHVENLLELANSLEPRLCAMHPKTPLQLLSTSVMSRLVYEVVGRFESKRLVDLPLSLEDVLQLASNRAKAFKNDFKKSHR